MESLDFLQVSPINKISSVFASVFPHPDLRWRQLKLTEQDKNLSCPALIFTHFVTTRIIFPLRGRISKICLKKLLIFSQKYICLVC